MSALILRREARFVARRDQCASGALTPSQSIIPRAA